MISSCVVSYSTLPCLVLAGWTGIMFASSPDRWPRQMLVTCTTQMHQLGETIKTKPTPMNKCQADRLTDADDELLYTHLLLAASVSAEQPVQRDVHGAVVAVKVLVVQHVEVVSAAGPLETCQVVDDGQRQVDST
jgi:hypothetical protein